MGMTVGNRITLALKMRGISQKELANKTRMTEQTISRYVHDVRTPNAKAIKILCKALCVSADWLLGVENGNDD
ncbi:MAG: helix-turn-helix transcriptional regulator [Bacilli bacterium]|nr:helix-turn-helix transcriptional regulator [Bacilli bacterium]